MSKILEEVYQEVANLMGVPLFEVNAITAREANAEIESMPPPLMVYFAGANGKFYRDLHNSAPFVQYTSQRVYFLGRPADETPDSLQSTSRQLHKIASEFVQRFSKTDAYTVPENPPFAPSINLFYPVFDSKLMQAEIVWDGILDIELPPIC